MLWVSVSGGADSTAMALLLNKQGKNFKMIFSDTGAEFPETFWILTKLQKYLNKPLKVVSNGSFYQWIIQKNYFLPSIKARWCTPTLKLEPQQEQYNDDDIVAIGYRADEPNRNIKLKENQIAPLTEAGLTKRDVIKLCENYDLLNPIYKWRTNTSCFCCPFQRKMDWIGLYREHPELYMLAEQWEARSIEVSKTSTNHGEYTWSNSWRLQDLRIADQQQLKLFPESEDNPCSICVI